MNDPDDTSRERPDRPTNPPQSPRSLGAEENGHAIPFGEGVYGLGRGARRADGPPAGDPSAPGDRPQPTHRTSRSTPYSPDSGTFAGHEPPADEPGAGPEFDFRRLATELGLEGHTEGQRCVGWCPICRTSDVLRAVATPELRAAWGDFQRELIHAVRAAAERYAPAEPADPAERITEIPID